MKVLVTGATGFVGSAVVAELRGAGHDVIGLARTAAAADALSALGVSAHRGDLQDLRSLREGAAMADAVIHTAFIHDFTKYAANCEIDRQAIEALGTALAASDRPLVVTSATGLLPAGRVSDEQARPAGVLPRIASEQAADALAQRGVRVSVVRLPPSVHGDGDHGFVPMLIDFARRKGVSAYVGEGLNRWCAVHRLDAARVYRRVLETGARESRYHAVAEEGIAFHEIAAVIGRRLNLPVVAQSVAEAPAHFEWFAHFAQLDSPASSRQTREWLGWSPTQPGLLADIDRPAYFGG
ncbi:SDR family oxidoreductase [Hydrocarboniphaga effusa]|jgi:nucleoside-diphosphate-sugar epimerase|uniref:SDR family oxidoreductase n=1 Tax=Hydrocarboniphaga effusa TaxID=243629 RepID=UPI0031378E5A